MERQKQGLAWNERFNIGHSLVDGQHQRLFEMISELASYCEDGSDAEKLQQTLDYLVDYTVRHFNEEEELQTKYGYPDYIKHKALHEEFKVSVGELVSEFKESGSSAELSRGVNKVLVRWIVKHVIDEDKKIGVFIREASV